MGLEPIFCLQRMYRQNMVLRDMLEPVIQGMGYELLGIEHLTQGRHSVLRVYIDHESGIGIEDCERVSNQVTGVLDVNDPIRGTYNLEVSSPGLDRPLFTLDQFTRFIGDQVQLNLREKMAGRRRFKGELVSVNEDKIHLRIDGEDYAIDPDNIDKAHLVPFD